MSFKIKRITSVKDEVLEIVKNLDNQYNILGNLEYEYQLEIHNEKLLNLEVNKFIFPLDMA